MTVACEVECAYCHEVVSLDGDTIGRAVPCPECDGMLALVSAVPTVAAPAPPEPPAPPDFPALSVEARKPGQPYVKPNVRAHRLRPAWPRVLRGLNTVRWAVLIALYLYVILLVADLVVFAIVPGRLLFPWDRAIVRAVVILQLIPLALHTAVQRACADGAAIRGAYLARRSTALVWCAVVVLLVLSVDGRWPFAVLLLVASGLWLTFLARLGRHLGDRAFVFEVWSFAWLSGAGVAMVFALAGGAYLARLANNIEVGWMCRAASGFIGLVIFCAYDRLLTAAARTVAQHAPVKTRPEHPGAAPPGPTRNGSQRAPAERPILPG